MSIWRWADSIDPVPKNFRITLGEGSTPLVRSRRIGREAGLDNLYFKLDSSNPSGSYKDRFAACAISHMLATGKRRCIATSSGNTGAALAAYCAAAGIDCQIAIVEAAPAGKLQQMLAYGANIFRVRGFGAEPDVSARVFAALVKMSQQPGSAIQISAFKFSPSGMTGVRSIAYELAEQLNGRVDRVFTQAGGGGLSVAVAQGFQILKRQNKIEQLARVECVQPEGNNTIAGALRDGLEVGQDVKCSTAISGLQVPNIIDGHDAIRECRATGGTGHLVTDGEVWEAQRRLCREEGIFCEPAAATSVAGALRAARDGLVDRHSVVVALITGVGFKDPMSVERMITDQGCPLIEVNELEERASDR